MAVLHVYQPDGILDQHDHRPTQDSFRVQPSGIVTRSFCRQEGCIHKHRPSRQAHRPGDFNQSMREFYRIVLPVSLKLERWNDINSRSSVINELRLVLHLPGQREYRQGMVSFDG